MPNINEILSKLEVLNYATKLDFNMSYDNILLRENKSNSCIIILPWGKYCYNNLPIVISNSPDIFQQKLNHLFLGFQFIRACIDKILILKNLIYKDQLKTGT